MLRATFRCLLFPLRHHSLWRWIAALLIGAVTWGLAAWWLEPRPQWVKDQGNSHSELTPICENDSGTLLLASETAWQLDTPDRFRNLTNDYVILNANTGETLHRLAKTATAWTDVDEKSFRFIDQVLWFTAQKIVAGVTCLELRAWDMTRQSQPKVVKQWINPKSTAFDITFGPRNSSHFLVRTDLPWHPALATLLCQPWTGLTSILALQDAEEWMTWPVPIIPWYCTYQLSGQQAQLPKLLASWTLPALRWGRMCIGPDLDWIMLGDTALPSRWNNNSKFCKPSSLLFYNAKTGYERRLSGESAFHNQIRKVVAWDNIVRICEVGDPEAFRWYDGGSGRSIQWPDTLPGPYSFGFHFHDRFSHSRGIYNKDGILHYISLTDTGLQGKQMPVLESLDRVHISEPRVLQGLHLGYVSIRESQPEVLQWMGQRWPWLMELLNKHWPNTIEGIHFFDINNGRLVWKLDNVIEQKLQLESTRHFYTVRTHQFAMPGNLMLPGIENYQILEAWALPFRYYSPWCSRAAGLLACLLILLHSAWLHSRRTAQKFLQSPK